MKTLYIRKANIIYNADDMSVHFTGTDKTGIGYGINKAKKESRKLTAKHGLGAVRLSN